LIARGIKIFIGPRVKEHFLVVDSKSYILSNPHPPKIGERTGELHENEPEKAAKVKERFERLLARAKPLDKIDLKHDSLRRALEKPSDWK
jgi:hypothetical protein